MNTRSSLPLLLLLLVLAASLLLAGCTGATGLLPEPTATAAPSTSTTQLTATATATPEPTATATSAPTDTPTAVPSPTEDEVVRGAMKKTATAGEMNAKVIPDLETYGVNPDEGHVAWASDKAVKLEVKSYLENKNHVLEDVGSVADFVVQSDITWETSGALSLCGITFHANEDLAMGAQNRFFLMRLQYDPQWTIWRWEWGQFQFHLPGSWSSSRDIHDENGSENTVALVVRGKDINIYINGDHQRWLEDTKLKDGLIAFSANQESGTTKCTFQNAWVWVFDK